MTSKPTDNSQCVGKYICLFSHSIAPFFSRIPINEILIILIAEDTRNYLFDRWAKKENIIVHGHQFLLDNNYQIKLTDGSQNGKIDIVIEYDNHNQLRL